MTPKIGDIFRNYFCGAELKVIGVKEYNAYDDTWIINFRVYDPKGCKLCEKNRTILSSIVLTTKEYSYSFVKSSKIDTEIL